jgi:hypothetical protein
MDRNRDGGYALGQTHWQRVNVFVIDTFIATRRASDPVKIRSTELADGPAPHEVMIK